MCHYSEEKKVSDSYFGMLEIVVTEGTGEIQSTVPGATDRRELVITPKNRT